MLWLAHQQLKSRSARIRRQAVVRLREGLPSAVIPAFAKVLQEDPDPAVRGAAAEALGDHKGEIALNALVSALTDGSELVRAAAVEGLRQMGDAGAVPALVPLLKNSEPSLRARVAQALSLLGWRAPDAEHEALFLVARGELDRAAILGRAAVGALAEVLKDPAYQRRVVAVNRLAELGDAAVVPPLMKALHDADALVRSAAARALGRIGAGERAAKSVLALLRDPDANVRVAAAEALGLLSDTEAIAPLVAAIADRHWEVRGAAVEALGRLQARDALETLSGCLTDADRDVRELAAEALGRLSDPRAIGPLAVAMLDTEASVRHAVSRALQQIDPYWFQSPALEEVGDSLRAGLKHPDYAVKQAAADILRRSGAVANWEQPTATTLTARRRTAREVFEELLLDPDPALRQAALECLARTGDPIPAARRKSLLADADPSVRRAALSGLEPPPPG